MHAGKTFYLLVEMHIPGTLDIKIHQYETTLEQNSKHIWKSKYCQIKDSISRNNFWQSK